MDSQDEIGKTNTHVLNTDLSKVMESLIADHSEIAYLVKYIEHLQNRISELEKSQDNSGVEVIEIRDIPRDQAKQEIQKFFKDGKYHDVGEIADELRLDIQLVFEISNELIEEGSIGG